MCVPSAYLLPPLWTSGTGVVHLSQSGNLQWHVIITQSPQCTLGFTVGAEHSRGLDKSIMTRTRHYNIVQNSFTNPLRSAFFIPPPLPLATTYLFTVSILKRKQLVHCMQFLLAFAMAHYRMYSVTIISLTSSSPGAPGASTASAAPENKTAVSPSLAVRLITILPLRATIYPF